MDVSIIPVTCQDDEDTNITCASAAGFPDVRHCWVRRGSPSVVDQMAGVATEGIKIEIVGFDAPREKILYTYCSCTNVLNERESGLRDLLCNIPPVGLVRDNDHQSVCPPILRSSDEADSPAEIDSISRGASSDRGIRMAALLRVRQSREVNRNFKVRGRKLHDLLEQLPRLTAICLAMEGSAEEKERCRLQGIADSSLCHHLLGIAKFLSNSHRRIPEASVLPEKLL
jgi:hypothetical protein